MRSRAMANKAAREEESMDGQMNGRTTRRCDTNAGRGHGRRQDAVASCACGIAGTAGIEGTAGIAGIAGITRHPACEGYNGARTPSTGHV